MRQNIFFSLLSICLICLSLNQQAQRIHGSFKDANVTGKTLYIGQYIGTDAPAMDSCKIGKDLKFEFKKARYEAGLYQLSFDEETYHDIIINPEEPEISIEYADGNDLLASSTILQSIECHNLNVWELKKVEIDNKVEAINNQLRSTPRDNRQRREYLVLSRDSFRLYEQEYLVFMLENTPENSIYNKIHKNYLFPSFEEHKQKPNSKFYENNNLFLNEHLLDKLDFSDEFLTYTKVFPEMAWELITVYTQFKEPMLIKSVYRIMDNVAGNDLAKQQMTKYLLEQFESNGPNIMFQFMVENFLLEGACGDVEMTEPVKLLADVYEKLLPGNKAPLVSLPDTEGTTKAIADIAAKHTGTMIFFWSSHCNYCKEALPEVKRLYMKYKSQGFQVIGISLDNNKAHWTQAIDQYNMVWENLSDLKGWKNVACKAYKVHKTPYYYLLSSDMTIISKPRSTHYLKLDLEKLYE